MCARSMHVAVGSLGKAFADATGHEVSFDFGTVGVLQGKLDAGETADVVILSRPAIDKLAQQGRVDADVRKDVARTFIALCVRQGAPVPEFGTAEAFQRLLESSQAFALSDPGVGGSAGVHLAKAFEQAGLTELITSKGMPQQSGAEVAKRVVEGNAEFGLTLSGEVASVAGAVIAGPLPPPFGQDTVYTASVMTQSRSKLAAQALIGSLTASDTKAVWTQAGFEQAG